MIETKFKNSEVGLIPEDWKVEPIKRLCKVNGRIGFRGYNKSDLVPFGMGAYTIGGKHITHNELDLSDPDFISWEKYYESPEIMVEKGDIVMAQRGTLGRAAYIKENVGPATINPSLVLLNHIKVDAQYLHYIIVSDKITDVLINSGSQTSVPMISQAQIESTLIPIPIPIEQTRIATALSDIDDLIATTKKLIEKKRNIKEGAMQELLSGKRRLPGFKEKWVEKEVGLTGFTYNGLSGKSKEDFGSGNSLYITFLNVLSNPVIDTSCFEKININPNERQNRALKGDIFFNTSSETPEEVGFCAYLDESIDNLYLNSFCFGFRITDQEIDGHFISYFWRSRKGRDIMTMLAQGSTRFNLSKALFKASFITIPSTKKEQKAIASVLSDMDSEIQSLESRLTKYQSLKQGMMQQLLTGKIRLI